MHEQRDVLRPQLRRCIMLSEGFQQMYTAIRRRSQNCTVNIKNIFQQIREKENPPFSQIEKIYTIYNIDIHFRENWARSVRICVCVYVWIMNKRVRVDVVSISHNTHRPRVKLATAAHFPYVTRIARMQYSVKEMYRVLRCDGWWTIFMRVDEWMEDDVPAAYKLKIVCSRSRATNQRNTKK